MKVLKIIIGITVLVIALIFGYLAMLPSTYSIERSITIEAPQALIMEHLAKFSDWENWSPWKAKDPQAKYTYEGKDGVLGSKMSWVTSLPTDNKNQIGEGGMILTELTKSTATFELWFVKPWEMTSKNGFELTTDGNKTIVRWYDSGEFSFFARPAGKIIKDKVGPDFESGLAKLKALVEKFAASIEIIYVIEEVIVDSVSYYSLTDSVNREKMTSTTETMLTGLTEFAANNDIEVSGAPFTIYHYWDSKTTKMECGIPVTDNSIEGKDRITAGSTYTGNALKTTHLGGYKNSEKSHSSIGDYVEIHRKMIIGNPWEVYIAGPMNEPDTSKWITEIYYPIQ
jgi:effector-binding domain-containing protein